MKVAIFSESAADEAALRVLVDAILGVESEPVSLHLFRARRGWTNVLSQLPAVFKYLHYRTDAEALVAVVDSNGSPVHVPAHEKPGNAVADCRLCRLREIVGETRRAVGSVPGRGPLRAALGLAVPAVEAWYLCGVDPHATETAWARDLMAGVHAPTRVRKLKQDVYGTDRPSLPQETERAKAAARRLAEDLSGLDRDFPGGFGALKRDVRGWLETP